MAWFKRFATPILLADGRVLFTLQDAANYIAALPKAESHAADWQLAREALVVAERRGRDTTLAWSAMMKALNRDEPPPSKSSLRIVK